VKLSLPRSPRHRRLRASLERALRLAKEDRFEEAEAEARACEAGAPRLWGRGRRTALTWYARTTATAVACAHGRGTEVLAEMEALIAELDGAPPPVRTLRLLVRNNRAAVLNWQGRYAEAEAEAQAMLRELAHLKHLEKVWQLELSVLDGLAESLCGLGRHEEAEAIARGNLPRAQGVDGAEAALHSTLVRSLNGQGRYTEALTEARRLHPERERGHTGRLDLATAGALLGLGRRAEAAEAARRALADCETHLHPAHPRLEEARTLLGRITAGPGTAV
jgi:tetratricopeptide (TPR) repeat protein